MIKHARFSKVFMLSSLISLVLLLAGMGCGIITSSVPTGIVTLASGDGITITGQQSAVPQGITLTVSGLTQAQAQAAVPFTPSQIFVIAADCGPDGISFYSPVTINFPLPNKLIAGTRLPFYMLLNNAWVNTGIDAVVSNDGLTASAQVTHFTKYILFLDDSWEKVIFGENTLISRKNGIPLTIVNNPEVLASGKTDDPAVIAKVMEVNRMTMSEAVYHLRSYDTSGDRVVQVLRLTDGVIVTRYWANDPNAKLGHWYNVSDKDTLYSPDGARQYFALPISNTALNVTQYELKPGSFVVYGVCADMTWAFTTFGPYATGGGSQAYSPDSTTWDGHSVHVNPEVLDLQTELRYTQ